MCLALPLVKPAPSAVCSSRIRLRIAAHQAIALGLLGGVHTSVGGFDHVRDLRERRVCGVSCGPES